MNWIYNSIPNTNREVLVAFRATELLNSDNVRYTLSTLDSSGKRFLLPDSYEIIGWADFTRCTKDASGNALTHHYLNVEGLKL